MAHFEGHHCDAHGPNCKGPVKNFVVRLFEQNSDDPSGESDTYIQRMDFDACDRGMGDAWTSIRHEAARRRLRKAMAPSDTTAPEQPPNQGDATHSDD